MVVRQYPRASQLHRSGDPVRKPERFSPRQQSSLTYFVYVAIICALQLVLLPFALRRPSFAREEVKYIFWTFWRTGRFRPHPSSYNGLVQAAMRRRPGDARLSLIADKYRAKPHIQSILSDAGIAKDVTVPETLAVFASVNDVVQAEPDRFPVVLKSNADSGGVFVIRTLDDWKDVTSGARLHGLHKRPYGYLNGEWHYSFIEPLFFLEEFIESDGVDYKAHCVYGEIAFIQAIWDRPHGGKEAILLPDGQPTALRLAEWFDTGTPPPIDAMTLTRMSMAAAAIVGPWPYMRLDMMRRGDRIVIGELTPFPRYGCYATEDNRRLGSLLASAAARSESRPNSSTWDGIGREELHLRTRLLSGRYHQPPKR